jgi:polar amino acid transport system substrate-binding protein
MTIRKDQEKSISCFVSAAILVTLFFCAIVAFGQDVPTGNDAVESEAAMPFMLLQIQADVQGSLNDLDLDVANASQNLSATGLEGAAAHEVLHKLLEANSNLVEAVTFSKDGKIIIAECKGCEGGMGADISSQEHIADVLKTKTPTFSKQFLLVEGYNGTALVYPVFSPQGECSWEASAQSLNLISC